METAGRKLVVPLLSSSDFGGLFLPPRSFFYWDVTFKLTLFSPHESLHLTYIRSGKIAQPKDK